MYVCVYVCILTYEARRGRIGLDVLLSVALDHIPQSPHIAGVEDVERLARVELAVVHVRTEEVVVGTGIPLRRGGGQRETPQFRRGEEADRLLNRH